jgi:predicted DNA-binding transcriptional regulator AlpA
MGAAEIQERLGYSRQWTYVLIGRRNFPEPVETLAMGQIWLAEDVEEWIAKHRAELAEEPEGE